MQQQALNQGQQALNIQAQQAGVAPPPPASNQIDSLTQLAQAGFQLFPPQGQQQEIPNFAPYLPQLPENTPNFAPYLPGSMGVPVQKSITPSAPAQPSGAVNYTQMFGI